MPFRTWLFIAAFGLAFAGLGYAKDDVIGPIDAPQESQQQTTKEPAIEPAPIVNIAPTNRASDEHNEGAAADNDKESKQFPYGFLGDTWAQWAMAIIGFLALWVSAWAVWLIKRTLGQTIVANENALRSVLAAEENTFQSVRPWIKITPTIIGAPRKIALTLRWRYDVRDGSELGV